MRKCCICGSFLTPSNEGVDHIGFVAPADRGRQDFSRDRYLLNRRTFLCQACLDTIQNQLEFNLSHYYIDA